MQHDSDIVHAVDELDFVKYGDRSRPAVVLLPPTSTGTVLAPLARYLSTYFFVVLCSTRGLTKPFNRNIREFRTIHHAVDVAVVIDTLSIESCMLVGWCSGAQVACSTTALLGSRITALFLLAPGTPYHSQFEVLNAFRQMQQIASLVWADENIAASLTKQMAQVPPQPGARPEDDFVSRASRDLYLSYPDAFRQSLLLTYQLYHDDDWFGTLSAVKCPVYMAVTDADELVALSNVEYLRSRLKTCTQLTMFEGSHASFTVRADIHDALSREMRARSKI